MAVFKFRNLNTGQATPIPPGEFTVGRADDTYVHVEDGSVSRQHAQIFNLDEGFFIQDNGSANGTAMDGTYISGRTQMNIGDVVYVGSVPFRIDPEVAGETNDAPPSAGMRTAKQSYMRRDTERLPGIGEAPRVVEKLSPEKLVAPQLDETKDQDAEEINAITIREPEPMEPMRLPSFKPAPSPQPKPAAARTATPVATPPKPIQEPEEAAYPVRQLPLLTPTTFPPSKSTSPEQATSGESVPGLNWQWRLFIFLAGLGLGLLLGLIFAKLFIDMGGKPASLP